MDRQLTLPFPGGCMFTGNQCKRGWFHYSLSILLCNRHLLHKDQWRRKTCWSLQKGTIPTQLPEKKCWHCTFLQSQMWLKLYISFFLHLYVSLGSILNLMLWRRCARDLVRLRHEKHFRVRKISNVALKYKLEVARDVTRSIKNTRHHTNNQWFHTFTHKCWSAVLNCGHWLASFSTVTPQPSPPPPDITVRS